MPPTPAAGLAVLLSILSTVALPRVTAQAPATGSETPLAAGDLEADLAVLRRAFTELHPGLYRYQTTAQVDAGFARLAEGFRGGRSLREAYLDLSRFLARIRCGHTYANFFNQPEHVAEALFAGRPCLPFAFRWIDGEMVVTANASGDARLVRGTRVTAVDGESTTAILEAMLPFARADGGNDGKRVALLEVSGLERLATFDMFFALREARWPTKFVLTATPPGASEPARLEVAAITAEQRAKVLATAAATVAGAGAGTFPFAGWSFEALGDGVAVLRMDTWVMFKTDWKWREALDALVDRLIDDGTRHLIVDLRENEGGNDVGYALLARLIDQPRELPRTGRYARYRRVPPELNPHLDTWDDAFRDWGDVAIPASAVPGHLGLPTGSWFEQRTSDDLPATLQPQGRRLDARLWVLVGPTNSSATFQFAQTVKAMRLGTLVGGTTGGNQRGINGGCFFFLRLPKSGIEIDLPLIAQVPAGDAEPLDGGVAPDIAIRETAADIAAGVDVHRRAVLAAIAAAK
ncbi:MAG: peptidase S41 [Planctomycetes bacterium]|nr:peptidase S41 [Planctomycetota bacterium]